MKSPREFSLVELGAAQKVLELPAPGTPTWTLSPHRPLSNRQDALFDIVLIESPFCRRESPVSGKLSGLPK